MKKIITVLLCLLISVVFTSCGVSEQVPKEISLQISEREVDVQYMSGTDLTVFGAESSDEPDREGALHISFSSCEVLGGDENMMLVSGSGELAIYSHRYTFTFEDEIMSRVRVSDSNTVYESILTSSTEIDDRSVEMSIDMVASEDFSQAVATVSAEDGILFFGDIFNDYLEYFNMILEGALNE